MFRVLPCYVADAAPSWNSAVEGAAGCEGEPLADRGAGERGQMLTGLGVRRRRRYDDRVRHRPGVLQNRDEPGDRRLLPADGKQPCLTVSTYITYHSSESARRKRWPRRRER
jgi:hypothetical protein